MSGAKQITITGTGYNGQARLEVRYMVEQLGARYLGDLTYGVTTHLVCSPAVRAVTEKISAAYAWRIPVVKHDWLMLSLQDTCLKLPVYRLILTSSDWPQSPLPPAGSTITCSYRTKLDPASPCHLHDTPHDNGVTVEPERVRATVHAAVRQTTDLMLSPGMSPLASMPCLTAVSNETPDMRAVMHIDKHTCCRSWSCF